MARFSVAAADIHHDRKQGEGWRVLSQFSRVSNMVTNSGFALIKASMAAHAEFMIII